LLIVDKVDLVDSRKVDLVDTG